MTTNGIKIGPKTRGEARIEVFNLLRFLKDYSKPGKRAMFALREELYRAYCEANFGVEGDYCPSLDEADILKAVADMIGRDWGWKDEGYKSLEARAQSMKS